VKVKAPKLLSVRRYDHQDLRTHLGVLVLLLYCLYHNLELVRESTFYYVHQGTPDPVTAFEQRFAGLRSSVLHLKHLGYVTDTPEDQPADWFRDFELTQYCLSPTIVSNSANYPFVVGISRNSRLTNYYAFQNEPRLSLVFTDGHGVFLLRGQSR
jgi:hypothetical protein